MLKLQRREQLLEQTFATIRQQLATITSRPDYDTIVQHLIREAATHLGEEAFIVDADAKTRTLIDEAYLQRLAEDLHVHLELAPYQTNPDTGRTSFKGTGIVLTTVNGHQRYDNTFEARLTRRQDELRSTVYHILAEDTPAEELTQ